MRTLMNFRSRAALALVLSMLVLSMMCRPAHSATISVNDPAHPAPSAVTIDDLLNTEHPDYAWFSPDGQSVLFSHSIALSERVDRRINSNFFYRRVFVAAAHGGERREIIPSAGTTYSPVLGDLWSPDSSGALLMAMSDAAFRLAFWNQSTDEVTVLPGRPRTAMPEFSWVGERVVYASLPDTVHQTFSMGDMLDGLGERWNGAWTGEEAQISIYSTSPVFDQPEPPVGSLIAADPLSGEAREIADGDYAAVAASPNGRYVAALRLAEELADGDSIDVSGRRGELQIFAVGADGWPTLRQSLASLDATADALSWSADGDRVLFHGRSLDEPRGSTRAWELDLNTSAQAGIGDPNLSFVHPSVNSFRRVMPAAWLDGVPVAIAGRPSTGATAASPVAGPQLDYGAAAHLRFDLYAFSGGVARNLTSFSAGEVTDFIAPPGKDFALVVSDGALWRVGLNSGPTRISSPEAGRIIAFDVDRYRWWSSTDDAYYGDGTAERVAMMRLGANGSVEHIVIDLSSGQALETATRTGRTVRSPDLLADIVEVHDGWESGYSLNRDGRSDRLVVLNADLRDKATAHVERFTYNVGGRELIGWVAWPPGSDPGEKLPAILWVYGGGVWGADPPRFVQPSLETPYLNGQLLAAHGYAVIYPSLPLGAGEVSDVPAMLAESATAAVDALVASGRIDSERVGITGMSFGGFSTVAILAKRSDRFRAGVALAGVYDFVSAYARRDATSLLSPFETGRDLSIWSVESGQIRLGQPFWRNADPYIRNSPIFHVDAIDAPILLLHGDLDLGTTSYGDAERLYRALTRAGKVAALVRYWGESHTVHSAAAQRDIFRRTVEWFDHYLGPERR